MSLVAIASPQSESELSVMLCTLEAAGIQAFVQGGSFGSLFPGPQIPAYNARRIMVSSVDAPKAQEALAAFAQPPAPVTYHWPGFLNVLRMIFEASLFGWFVPGNSRRNKNI
ncbi:MAG: hypothetical protein ACTHJG_07635 [Rhodanobacteraceae bacterium]